MLSKPGSRVFGRAVITVFLLVTVACGETSIEADEEEAEAKKAETVPPVHFEWPFFQENGLPERLPDDLPAFSIDSLSTPEAKALLGRGPYPLVLEEVKGAHVLRSVTEVPKGRAVNDLDIRVSLKVEKATTWEAVTALVITVNENPEASHPLFLRPQLWAWGGAPMSMGETRCIFVNAVNETAREVLLEILKQAPVSIKYSYVSGYSKGAKRPTGHIMLTFFENGAVLSPRHSSDEDQEFWLPRMEQLQDLVREAWSKSHP